MIAWRAKVFEVAPDGRAAWRHHRTWFHARLQRKPAWQTPYNTVAQLIADMLVDESLHARQRIMAANLILDRLEGRPAQQVTLDVMTDLDRRSDDGLCFYLEHSRWPNEKELLQLESGQEG